MKTDEDFFTLADLPDPIPERLLEDEAEARFQLLPPLEDSDRDALRKSVAERGIRVPVELDVDGQVLDGHHRLALARELELDANEIPVTVRDDLQSEEDALEYVLEVNVARRQLTQEGRRQIALKLRERGWSLRRIADRLGVSHETIRRDLEGAGVTNVTGDEDSGPSETVEGRDGKRYPASRSPDSSDGSGSGGQGRPPGHAQGRSIGSTSGSGNSSGRRNSQSGKGSAPGSDDSDNEESGPDRDPRLEHLDAADDHLDKAIKRTPDGDTEVRDRLEALADGCNAVYRHIAGTGDAWKF